MLINTIRNDSKKTWTLFKSMIGKNKDKSGIPTHFKYNNDSINTNIGQKHANAIPEPKQMYPRSFL